MPSMAGLHNVQLAQANPWTSLASMKLTYSWQIFGEWPLSFNIEKPGRDKIVDLVTFTGPDGGMEDMEMPEP